MISDERIKEIEENINMEGLIFDDDWKPMVRQLLAERRQLVAIANCADEMNDAYKEYFGLNNKTILDDPLKAWKQPSGGKDD